MDSRLPSEAAWYRFVYSATVTVLRCVRLPHCGRRRSPTQRRATDLINLISQRAVYEASLNRADSGHDEQSARSVRGCPPAARAWETIDPKINKWFTDDRNHDL